MSESSGVESTSISVFILLLPEEEKDPLLRELRRIDPELEYEEGSYGGGPSGSLPLDYVLTLVSIAVAGQYMKGFLSAAGAAHYQGLHECISRLINKITREEEEALEGVEEEELSEVEVEGELPRGAPLSVSAGRVHFYFQGKLTPEQVAERLSKAQEVVASLPEDDLRIEGREACEAGGPRNFVWDENTRSWTEKGPRTDKNLFP